jgi:hypothetical protein
MQPGRQTWSMNLLIRLIAAVSMLTVSFSFAWIALTLTEVVPRHHITVYQKFDGDVELTTGFGGFNLDHSGSLEVTD